MKNFILTLALTLFIFNPVYCQYGGDFRVGLFTGLNYALPVGDDIEDWKDDFEDYYDYGDTEASINGKVGMNLGISMDYFIADNLALSSGVSYSQKGFAVNLEEIPEYFYSYGSYYDYDYDQKVKVNLNYLDIPLALRYASDDGFEMFGGVILGVLFSDKVDAEIDVNGANDYYEDLLEDNADDLEEYEDLFDEDPEGMVNGFIFGLGYTIDEQVNISLSAQKTGSFGETPYGDDNENLTIQLKVGFFF